MKLFLARRGRIYLDPDAPDGAPKRESPFSCVWFFSLGPTQAHRVVPPPVPLPSPLKKMAVCSELDLGSHLPCRTFSFLFLLLLLSPCRLVLSPARPLLLSRSCAPASGLLARGSTLSVGGGVGWKPREGLFARPAFLFRRWALCSTSRHHERRGRHEAPRCRWLLCVEKMRHGRYFVDLGHMREVR
jgi:hypothetical protein